MVELVTRAPFGWLVRSLHVWGASFVVAAALVHLSLAFLRGAYRAPREGTWTSGLGLLGLVLALCFTGFLLPWDDRAFAGSRIGLQEVATAPVIGPILVELARGGPDIGAGTLTRFFVGHVVLLPAALSLLGLFHIHQVVRHGRAHEGGARPAGQALLPEFGALLPGPDDPGLILKPGASPRTPTRPRRARRGGRRLLTGQAASACAVLGLMVLVASRWPPILGPEADPLAGAPPGVRPEWFFIPVFELLHRMPAQVFGLDGLVVTNALMAAGGLVWFTLPWWDGRTNEKAGPGPLALTLGLATALGGLGLLVASYARMGIPW
jgi:quinol-cytochrome oxidoreductase complex cytochrome b subunit